MLDACHLRYLRLMIVINTQRFAKVIPNQSHAEHDDSSFGSSCTQQIRLVYAVPQGNWKRNDCNPYPCSPCCPCCLSHLSETPNAKSVTLSYPKWSAQRRSCLVFAGFGVAQAGCATTRHESHSCLRCGKDQCAFTVQGSGSIHAISGWLTSAFFQFSASQLCC